MSVDHEEVASFRGRVGVSPVEKDLPDGHFQAQRQIKCAWDDRGAMIAELGKDGGELYPHDKAKGARAISANTVGFGKADASGSLISYPQALITVYYSTRAPQIFNNKYFIVETLVPHFETKSQSHYKFHWDSAGGRRLDPGEAPNKIMGRASYTLEFHGALQTPYYALSLAEYCNASAWATLTMGFAFPTETLLLKTPVVRRTIKLGYLPRFLLIYEFLFKASGWNTFWREETNSYESIYHEDGSGRYIQHPLGDFQLLKP